MGGCPSRIRNPNKRREGQHLTQKQATAMAKIAIVLHGVLGEGDFPNSRLLETSGGLS